MKTLEINERSNEPMNLPRPGRLLAEQVARVLGFKTHEIPILVRAKLLKPIGNPPRQAVKYFFAAEIEKLACDQDWMSRATKAVYKYWSAQNQKRRPKSSGASEIGCSRAA